MIEIGVNYIEYLKKLKKEELIKIINDYNKLCDIYKEEKLDNTKAKKDKLVNDIVNIKDKYLKYLIMSLDLNDYNNLKEVLKKNTTKVLNEHKELINYLKDKYVIFQEASFQLLL